MALDPPRSLSPSAIGTFTNCALQYKFAYLDRLEQPATPEQRLGLAVHDALFRFYWNDPRTDEAGVRAIVEAAAEYPDVELPAIHDFFGRLRELEDPDAIIPIGLELKVEGSFDGKRTVRGIIDRLELLPDGTYCITDYKTGKAPSKSHLMQRMQQLLIYAALVEDALGPAGLVIGRIQLLCLGGKHPKRVAISPTRTQVEAAKRRANAVWYAVEDGCQAETFYANPGPLCGWCAFRDLCPTGDKYLKERGK